MSLGWERVPQASCWELTVSQLAILSIINSFKKQQTSMKKQVVESRAWKKCQLPELLSTPCPLLKRKINTFSEGNENQ